MVRPIAGYVVSMGADGRIKSQGSLSKALSKNKKLAQAVKKVEQTQKVQLKQAPPEASAVAPIKKPDGKLILAEEISVGHVGWPARTYLT